MGIASASAVSNRNWSPRRGSAPRSGWWKTRLVPFSVTWSNYDNEYEAQVATPSEALKLLRAVPATPGYDPIVTFSATPNGPFLGVSASDPAVVTFEEGLDPPYFVSVGEAGREDLVTLIYGRQESEMPARHLVSRADAESAVSEFLATGRRPAGLVWEET